MFPTDHLAAANKKYLNNTVPVIPGKRNNILIFLVAVSDHLFLADYADTFQQIPVFGSLFKFQIGTGFLHFGHQILHHRLIITIQKIHGFLYLLTIGFLTDIPLTRCHTLLAMMIPAWALSQWRTSTL